ncbi:MAG: hypothetical protein WEB13_06680 [Dehalococcoidia bacterium]
MSGSTPRSVAFVGAGGPGAAVGEGVEGAVAVGAVVAVCVGVGAAVALSAGGAVGFRGSSLDVQPANSIAAITPL